MAKLKTKKCSNHVNDSRAPTHAIGERENAFEKIENFQCSAQTE